MTEPADPPFPPEPPLSSPPPPSLSDPHPPAAKPSPTTHATLSEDFHILSSFSAIFRNFQSKPEEGSFALRYEGRIRMLARRQLIMQILVAALGAYALLAFGAFALQRRLIY